MACLRCLIIALLWFEPRLGLRAALNGQGDVPASVPPSSGGESAATYYTYQVVHVWPHDPEAFTQGLLFRDGELLESTGLYGHSSLRAVELETGRVLREISIPQEYFAEGLAVIGARAYQLTWQNQKGFIYDAVTFQKEGQFNYGGEGWGLTTDGRLLVLSDGTDQIRFLDPASFETVRRIHVALSGHPLPLLNELEWIKGEIFANVWQTDEVVRIDPSTGNVRGVVDFYGLLPPADRRPETDVLNGIAYDTARDRLFVTGKRWPKIFEVRLVPKSLER
jgi:glutaminyl-peptide cyclotransferase